MKFISITIYYHGNQINKSVKFQHLIENVCLGTNTLTLGKQIQ